MINSGRYNQRITLQEPTQTKGAAGGFVQTWQTVASPWASRADFAGGEQPLTKQGGGKQSTARTEFRLRYRPGVRTTMRILHGAEIFDIQHVDDRNQQHTELVLTCKSGGTNG